MAFACHLRALATRPGRFGGSESCELRRGAGARPRPRAQPRLFIVLLPSPTPPPQPWPAPSFGSLFLGQTGTCPLQGLPPSSRLSGSWHPWRGGHRRSGGVGVTSQVLARWKGTELPFSRLECPDPTGTSLCVGVCIGLRGLLNCVLEFWA